MQLAELRYVLRRGWECDEYVDTGWSGAKASRPEFAWLLQDSGSAQYRRDYLLEARPIWRRSLLHCKSAIERLRAHGVPFIATSQGIGTDESNPSSRFMLNILNGSNGIRSGASPGACHGWAVRHNQVEREVHSCSEKDCQLTV